CVTGVLGATPHPLCLPSFFFSGALPDRHLHSFPTRRSSDLALDPNSRFSTMPMFIRNPDGSKGMLRRQCTSTYKIKILHCLRSIDRKSTRLNSSHVAISYAVFYLKKKIKYAILLHQRDPIRL